MAFSLTLVRLALLSLLALPVCAQEACKVVPPTASLAIPHVSGSPLLDTDPNSQIWARAGRTNIVKDCGVVLEYPDIRTEVRAFWTDTYIYFLFECPYTVLNLFLPPKGGGPRSNLWDRDVVEMFLGSDWSHIRHYREFEIAPTGDWIDLAIDLDKQSFDQSWRSGWKTAARIDRKAKIWYAAARIPLSAVSAEKIKPGAKWRINLYRIEGLGEDPERHSLCWQPTCVTGRDSNHVPENFGTLTFTE